MRPPSGPRFPLLFLLAALLSAPIVLADSCSVAQPQPLSPGQIAMIGGNFAQAETLYRDELAKSPTNAILVEGLARSLLAEQKIPEAEAAVRAALAADPQSPPMLTALAEIQYREGLPWDEAATLIRAQAHGLCYPRLHLALSIYHRFSSDYAAALHELQVAHQLDPYDPAIQSAWMQTLSLDQRIDELKKYLAANDTDINSVRRAQYELAILQSRRKDRGASCHLASTVTSTDIDFTGIMVDAERIRGWGLEVAFNGHKARLQVDTGAGGLYVSRSVAEHAGLKSIAQSQTSGIGDKGAQSGYTAYADSIKIGALEFRNCVVEVSDRNNVVGTDGLIGMDVFSSFLVTLDFPWHKLTLSPLPAYPGAAAAPASLNTEQAGASDAKQPEGDAAASSAAGSASAAGPHDRYIAPEMKNWTQVYRVAHDLIVPTSLNNKTMRLFIMDTGAFRTSVSPAAAREVTKVSSDENSTVKGISGDVQHVYRGDRVSVQFGHLRQETDGMLSFDTASLSRNLGTEISGLLGFDVLHLLVVKIDYRDGLVDFEYSENRGYQHIR